MGFSLPPRKLGAADAHQTTTNRSTTTIAAHALIFATQNHRSTPRLGRFLGPAHPTGCVPGARGAFIPVGLGVPSHPCRLAGSAGVRPGALDVRQSHPARRTNDAFRRTMDTLAAQAAARAAKDRRNERKTARQTKRRVAAEGCRGGGAGGDGNSRGC